MTKKDFIVLAAALLSARPNVGARDDLMEGWRSAAMAIADACARSNPRFDRAKFLKASGGDNA